MSSFNHHQEYLTLLQNIEASGSHISYRNSTPIDPPAHPNLRKRLLHSLDIRSNPPPHLFDHLINTTTTTTFPPLPPPPPPPVIILTHASASHHVSILLRCAAPSAISLAVPFLLFIVASSSRRPITTSSPLVCLPEFPPPIQRCAKHEGTDRDSTTGFGISSAL